MRDLSLLSLLAQSDGLISSFFRMVYYEGGLKLKADDTVETVGQVVNELMIARPCCLQHSSSSTPFLTSLYFLTTICSIVVPRKLPLRFQFSQDRQNAVTFLVGVPLSSGERRR